MTDKEIDRQVFGRGAHRILYDAGLMTSVSLEWLQPEFWEIRQAVSNRLGGRGQALALETDLGRAVLRRYLRGGKAARLLHDRYLFTGYAASRAFREWRLLADLHAEGLPVPRPLAASCERSGLIYRAGLLTVEIPGARPLAELADTLPDHLWQALASTLESFFAAGVVHPDLNAHNLLLGADQCWYLIDFDRARRVRGRAPARAMIQRLLRSFDRLGLENAHRSIEPLFKSNSEHR